MEELTIRCCICQRQHKIRTEKLRERLLAVMQNKGKIKDAFPELTHAQHIQLEYRMCSECQSITIDTMEASAHAGRDSFL